MRHTRSTIERALRSELQISQREAQKILSMFIESIARALAAGDEVRLRGFGAFRVAAKQKDHSPGAPMRKCVKLRSSKHLKSLVQAVAEHDPILALLRQQIDSENSVESMLIQHVRWCENKAADRPNMALIDLEGRDLFGISLRSAKLTGAWMPRADLSEADLQGADLERADLTAASLAGANLKGANLRGACLKKADLRWADLRNADLSDANLKGADLRGALMEGTMLDMHPSRIDRKPWFKMPLLDQLNLKGRFSFALG
jgi:nucleoid DNA-binding protein